MSNEIDFIDRTDVKHITKFIHNIEKILIDADKIHDSNAPIKDQIDTQPVSAFTYIKAEVDNLTLVDNMDINHIIPAYSSLDDSIEFYYIYNCLREYTITLKESLN